MRHEQQFKKGDAVFVRMRGEGRASTWKRGRVVSFDHYGQRGERLYSVYIASKSGAFTVAEADLALADIDALTEVGHG